MNIRNYGRGNTLKVWMAWGIGLLAGCETEFERCMKAELPLAYEAVSEDEVAAGKALESLSKYLAYVRFSAPAQREWDANNPEPPISLARVSWLEKRQAKRNRLAESFFGTPVSSHDEYYELVDDFQYQVLKYVEPRSPTAQCQTDKCRQMPYEESLAIQMEEARAVHVAALIQLNADARRLAGRICNGHGFYE